MDTIRIDEVDSVIDSATVKRPLTDAVGATNVALNYYELAPGESFAYGYHAHETQEELFLVQEGAVTFETEEGAVEVGPGELVRFGPGEYQQGINEGDERVVAVAIGAPQATGDTDVRRDCPTCGERTSNAIEWAGDEKAKITRCLACGTETGRFE
jgi:uncharacterized cupin superfamily protein